MNTVNIAEGKRDFSRLIQESHEKQEDILVTKRGKPIAVIVPYAKYERARALEGYRKIMEARGVFKKAGVTAEKVFRESREQLEKRSS